MCRCAGFLFLFFHWTICRDKRFTNLGIRVWIYGWLIAKWRLNVFPVKCALATWLNLPPLLFPLRCSACFSFEMSDSSACGRSGRMRLLVNGIFSSYRTVGDAFFFQLILTNHILDPPNYFVYILFIKRRINERTYSLHFRLQILVLFHY